MKRKSISALTIDYINFPKTLKILDEIYGDINCGLYSEAFVEKVYINLHETFRIIVNKNDKDRNNKILDNQIEFIKIFDNFIIFHSDYKNILFRKYSDAISHGLIESKKKLKIL